MASDIEAVISKCAVCLKFRASQKKQPLIPHEIPEGPWLKLATYIMTLNGQDYIVVVYYFSKFPEVAKLEHKTAANVITHLKFIFSRHGIPCELMSENMPFASRDFHNFASECGIQLSTSSPNFPQSNGQSVRAVQTMKRLLKKAIDRCDDPYIALMEYRNTLVSGMQFSPAQMLMSRRLRSKLPMQASMLKPQIVKAKAYLKLRQQRYKHFHDRGSSDLAVLNPGDVVRVRNRNTWEPAVVVAKHRQPRSYIIKSNGKEFRRNRRHLMKTAELPPLTEDSDDSILDTFPQQPVQPPQQVHEEIVVENAPASPQHAQNERLPGRTLRGRDVKLPLKLADYVCKKVAR